MVIRQLDVFVKEVEDKVGIEVVFVFSDKDPYLWELQNITLHTSFLSRLVWEDNCMLGKKMNKGIKMAMNLKPDYVMNLGSDDLIHPDLIDLYMPYINARTMVFGLNRLYFHNLKDGKTVHFSYYNNPHVVGAGRMIHVDALMMVMLEYGGLYRNKINRCLDANSGERLRECGYKEIAVDPGDFPMVVDLKSDININVFSKILENRGDNEIREVDGKVVMRLSPESSVV